jgi:hypothetical protein
MGYGPVCMGLKGLAGDGLGVSLGSWCGQQGQHVVHRLVKV